MSLEIQQINDDDQEVINDINRNINNDNDDSNDSDDNSNNGDENNSDDADDEFTRKQLHNIDDASLSPSPSPSNSSTSLDMTLRGNTKNNKRSPLSLSYREWLNNWFSISIPAIGFLGCQLSLALQNGFVTPELEELGIPEKLVNYAWLAPPLTG